MLTKIYIDAFGAANEGNPAVFGKERGPGNGLPDAGTGNKNPQ
jgi:hypothetical protein